MPRDHGRMGMPKEKPDKTSNGSFTMTTSWRYGCKGVTRFLVDCDMMYLPLKNWKLALSNLAYRGSVPSKSNQPLVPKAARAVNPPVVIAAGREGGDFRGKTEDDAGSAKS